MDSSPIPAATLILLRDRIAAPPELLVVQRSGEMAFAAGALVFPGGRVDPGDHALAAAIGGGLAAEDAAARVAAIRETIEESGLAIGLDPAPDTAALAALRAGLHAGQPFGPLLAAAGLRLKTDTLVPFARWCPKLPHARIFDTRFYLARAPAGGPAARVDATENVRLFWGSATAVLAACDRGEDKVIFPTRRNLERLAQFASFADAVADAGRHPISTITPWIEEVDGERYLRIPEGRGYPVAREPVATAMRM
ncbi:NUDIX domain-containing protein [Sphingomonas flavalba]|uniref:NUDIX domain-containing protein n=1 Tax=Sphingomonas flavalba TaxID=2559804 RepID=UPI00109DB3CF|nr:NUDIX domain-containing protein [Sphingomonas flavalba]